jgi:anti-sigma regulatory factor (Ser/Thr protein kinase)
MRVVEPTAAGDSDRRTGGPLLPDLRLTSVPAAADALTVARDRLAAWAETAGLGAELVADVALAAYEAMANVVDHAYEGPGGVFDLHACRWHDSVTVTVTDHGRWRTRSGEGTSLRGRGLLMIDRMAHEHEVIPDRHGTTVRMSWSVPDGV